MEEEKTFECAKCKKTKKESDGNFVLDGSTYCCKDCCGDPNDEEHKNKEDDGTCEFC